jgi:sec-independent protein translocase protein TatC
LSNDHELEIWDHLEELSSRLRRIVIVLLSMMLVVMLFPSDLSKLLRFELVEYNLLITNLMQFLQIELLPEGVTLIAINWLDAFYIYFILSFAVSFVLSLPYIAYQIYGFLAPAIYENEKRSLFIFVTLFIFLFFIGISYAYFILVPATFTVLYRFVNQTGVMPFYSLKDFFELIAFGLFGSGLFYTFPLVLYLLVKIDLLTVENLRSLRRHIFLVLSIFTAVITPDPTPVSMLLMTIPFYFLYELTILILARVMRDKPDLVIEKGIKVAEEIIAREK